VCYNGDVASKTTQLILSVIVGGLLSISESKASNDNLLLEAIAAVETGSYLNDYQVQGDHGKAKGRYQLHRPAWTEGSAQLKREGKVSYGFSQWRRPEAQDAVAEAFLRATRGRFKARGIAEPSPEQLALVWHCGWGYASRINFNYRNASPSKKDYVQRVHNLINR